MITTQVTVEIAEVTTISVRLTPAGQERRDRLIEEGRCLGCERVMNEDEQTRCGQCDTCYARSRAQITHKEKSKRIRIQDLIRDGYMLPPQKGGRPPKNDYTRKLAEM